MIQRTLFPDPDLSLTAPIAHRGDPDTSHAAADRVTRSGSRAAHCQMVLAMVRRMPGLTACELWDLAGDLGQQDKLVELQEVRRRLCDLEAEKLVRKGEARECRVRGSKQVTWYPVGG